MISIVYLNVYEHVFLCNRLFVILAVNTQMELCVCPDTTQANGLLVVSGGRQHKRVSKHSTSVFPTVMLPVPVFCALPHVVCLFLVLVPPFEAMSDLFISLSLFFGYILS
jgi:hypothetical protein